MLHDSRTCSAPTSPCTTVHIVAMDHGVSAAGNCTLERAGGGRSRTFDGCASHEAKSGFGNGFGLRIKGAVFSCRFNHNSNHDNNNDTINLIVVVCQ